MLASSSPSTLLSKVSVKYQEILAEFPEIVGLGLRPALSSMVFATTLRQRDHPSQHRRAAWTRRNALLLRPSLRGWRRSASSWGPLTPTREQPHHQPTEVRLRQRGGPLPGNMQAVVQFPRPFSRLELQRFLALVNFYRRFLRGAAGFLLPLTDALQGPAAELKHPLANFPISLMVNASGSHVSTVLQHFSRSSWAPLSFFSKKLSLAETRYSSFDRELLAVYSAIRHFCLMLEGRQFLVLTDHKPPAMPWAGSLLPGPPDSSGIWRTSRSSLRIFDTSLELTMPPLMLSSSSSAFVPRPCRCAAFPRHRGTLRRAGGMFHNSGIGHWPPLPGHQETPRQRSCSPLLHFYRHGSTTSSAWVPPPGLWCTSCPFSPWYQGLPPSPSLQVFVAWHEQRCRCLGLKLPGLPENQGGQTRAPACSMHRRAFLAFLPRPCWLGGSFDFCTWLHTRVHCGGPLAHRLPHTRYRHNSLHQRPCWVDLQFRGPCHCNLGPRIPVHFLVVVCLLSLPGHLTHDDNCLPPSVQWRFFRQVGVWHTADPPWTIPVDARAPAEGVSQQPPPPHGSLHSAAFGAQSIASLWPHAFAACTLGSRVRVHLPRRCSSYPHTPVWRPIQGCSPFQHIFSPRYRL